jgi:hypothetical protein
MFDCREILKAAHRYARTFAGRDWSYKQLLRWGLQMEWERAKDRRSAAERHADAIRAEIAMLTYKSARIDIVRHRRQLEAELTALAA